MQIIWRGQSCFQIISAQGKNGYVSPVRNKTSNGVNIVIDPFDEKTGLRVPKLESDILLVSHNHHDHNNIKAVLGSPFIINGPGEYEIKEVFIWGISGFHDDSQGKERGEIIIYVIEVEGMRVCHLGDLGQKELTPEQIEKIGDIDVLMLPIGGVYTISAKEAIKIMSQIEPKITIPMHYQISKTQASAKRGRGTRSVPLSRCASLALDLRGRGDEVSSPLKVKLDGLDKFLKIVGIKSIEPLSKLSIKKKDLLEEEAKIIVLKPEHLKLSARPSTKLRC